MATEMIFDFEGMTPPQFLHAARKAAKKLKNAPGNHRPYMYALLDWSDNNPINFGPESAMGRLNQIIYKFDDVDDEDLDDRDVAAFIRVLEEFFRTVTAADISNVENWELSTNMSPNLLALFGRPKNKQVVIETDWKAPDKVGMENSEPIVPSATNSKPQAKVAEAKLNKPEAKESDAIDDRADSKQTSNSRHTSRDFIAAKSVSDSRHASRDFNATKSECHDATATNVDEEKQDGEGGEERETGGVDDDEEDGDEEDDDDDWDDDDDDEDYGYGDDDDGGELPAGLTMSANLMRALGLDTSGIDETTDWKPPEKTGIEANPDSLKAVF